MGEKKERATRSDKKRDVKPTISSDLYECIGRLSYITRRPIKDVGETICEKGLVSDGVIESLSPNFKRDYWLSPNRMVKGQGGINQTRILRVYGEKRRIKIRFRQDTYEKLCDFAHALDFTVSSACSLLLEMSTMSGNIIHTFIEEYMDEALDEPRKKQLRHVLSYINMHSPYEEEITMTELFNWIVEELRTGTENIKNTVDQYLQRFIDHE
ncbi:hypothetical protein [Salibacterium aidingense]|uniref:hypothetical protein n=1 Tax=Salibacterium aidingense TaxID=384933 RepID=UPI00047AF333|nr:hypothetical protein [Salibacterium aidingense]